MGKIKNNIKIRNVKNGEAVVVRRSYIWKKDFQNLEGEICKDMLKCTVLNLSDP